MLFIDQLYSQFTVKWYFIIAIRTAMYCHYQNWRVLFITSLSTIHIHTSTITNYGCEIIALTPWNECGWNQHCIGKPHCCRMEGKWLLCKPSLHYVLKSSWTREKFAKRSNWAIDDKHHVLIANHVIIVEVPSNCTDRLQPLDISVNVPYMIASRLNFDHGCVLKPKSAIKPAHLHLSVMKSLGAK